MNPNAGRRPDPSMLVDVDNLLAAYFDTKPDPSDPSQRVAFGTSGHRGSSLRGSFNEAHILAMTEAICLYRRSNNIDGPLFMGKDTHALSEPAFRTAVEVLVANGVELMAEFDGYTPTPVISRAILVTNRSGRSGVADGIVVTPSHNPPEDGGFKYNPPTGGPADTDVTRWIQDEANRLLAGDLDSIGRTPFEQAVRAPGVHHHRYVDEYVSDLPSVVDVDAIRSTALRLGADPLGGASVAYWPAIGEQLGLDITVVNDRVDPAFSFMTLDWDGRIRMDCSSPSAMAGLIELKDRFDVAFGNDTDADRHGIVTPGAGLLNPNHYLSVAVSYLFGGSREWGDHVAVGKTVVSSSMIDRVTASLSRRLLEVPVGFKWFVSGLLDGSLGFGGEESAGGSFLRRDGSAWTTDKDGIVLCLLAAEITAKSGADPGELYQRLTERFGRPAFRRIDAPATPEQKRILGQLSPSDVTEDELAGERIAAVLTTASGNGAPIGGLKVVTENGWFAARPSGTEDVYKVYAESFLGEDHLARIIEEAQALVASALASAGAGP
jgi:phosphoglucomutase